MIAKSLPFLIPKVIPKMLTILVFFMTFFGFPLEIAVEYLEFVNRGGNSNGKKVVRTRLHAECVLHEPTTIT